MDQMSDTNGQCRNHRLNTENRCWEVQNDEIFYMENGLQDVIFYGVNGNIELEKFRWEEFVYDDDGAAKWQDIR